VAVHNIFSSPCIEIIVVNHGSWEQPFFTMVTSILVDHLHQKPARVCDRSLPWGVLLQGLKIISSLCNEQGGNQASLQDFCVLFGLIPQNLLATARARPGVSKGKYLHLSKFINKNMMGMPDYK